MDESFKAALSRALQGYILYAQQDTPEGYRYAVEILRNRREEIANAQRITGKG